jgi:hypothetical protein
VDLFQASPVHKLEADRSRDHAESKEQEKDQSFFKVLHQAPGGRRRRNRKVYSKLSDEEGHAG